MAHGGNSNFLTIPSQEGLFRTVRVERSEDNSNDEDDEEAEEDIRLIPRCSPVPRKRGPSIADETAEYMRIRLVLPPRRVSFADTTGGELVDVRLFVPFDSDDEDDDSRWEEEEARYRKAYREPTYRFWPEFEALAGAELLLSVHTNKLEVESVTPVPDEPLSFTVLIRVLNISFHKSVQVRSTMDGWITHFDYPTEYVEGSNDGETDRFSVKLSFAAPYLFNGARIDFVVRYETSDGEFWANNSGRNYSVTLLQSYEDDTSQSSKVESIELKGILRPPRYRADVDFDDYYDKEDEDLSDTECESMKNQTFVQPTIVQPEIDIESAKNLSSPPQSIRHSSIAGCPQSRSDTPDGEPHPLKTTSSNNSPQSVESTGEGSRQPSEPQDQVFNILPFLTPAILVHKESTEDESDDSTESDQFQKDDSQPGISAQVPFEFGQSSLVGCPDTLYIQEEGAKNLKEEKDVQDIPLEMEERMEETFFQILEEPVQPPSSKEVNNENGTKNVEDPNLTIAVDSSQRALKEESQEQEVEHASSVKAETTKETEEMLTVENMMSGEEITGLVTSYLLPPHVSTHSGPPQQDKATQRPTICPPTATSGRDLATMEHQQDEELILEQTELSSAWPVDPSYGKQTISKQEISELTRVSGRSSTTPDLDFSLHPSTVDSSTEEDKSFQGDALFVTPHKTDKDLEIQLSLPRESTKISDISKDRTEVTLDKSLIASFTFFSAMICLAIGIQQPSIFLFVGLFLLSLCF